MKRIFFVIFFILLIPLSVFSQWGHGASVQPDSTGYIGLTVNRLYPTHLYNSSGINVHNEIIMTTAEYIGLGASDGRIVFTEAGAKDYIIISDAFIGINKTPGAEIDVSGNIIASGYFSTYPYTLRNYDGFYSYGSKNRNNIKAGDAAQGGGRSWEIRAGSSTPYTGGSVYIIIDDSTGLVVDSLRHLVLHSESNSGAQTTMEIYLQQDGTMKFIDAGSYVFDQNIKVNNSSVKLIEKKTITYSDASGAVNILQLPASAVIWSIKVEVTTLFNGSGTDLLDIGVTGTGNYYKDNLDISGAGWTTTMDGNIPNKMAGSTQIIAQYFDQNTDASAGSLDIYIEYSLHE